MKNSKITRLILGLIILCSLFIFQGSDSEDSCSDCTSEDNLGYLVVQNSIYSQLPISITITPSGKTSTISHNYQRSFDLEAGSYTVVAKDSGFSQAIIGSKSAVITAGGTVTITFR